MGRAQPLVAVALLVCVAAGTGCRSIRERAQDGLEQALPQVLGPAASYQVRIDGPSGRIRRGRIERVRIDGKRVRAQGLPQFEEMHLDARDLVIDMESRSVKSCGAATMSATLTEAELTKILNQRVRLLQQKRVRSREGYVRIEGTLRAGPLSVRGASDYTLVVKKGVEIWATPMRVSFAGAGANLPRPVRTRAAAVLNPIYTLTEERLKVRLTQIVPKNGHVLLTGTLDPTGLHLEEPKPAP